MLYLAHPVTVALNVVGVLVCATMIVTTVIYLLTGAPPRPRSVRNATGRYVVHRSGGQWDVFREVREDSGESTLVDGSRVYLTSCQSLWLAKIAIWRDRRAVRAEARKPEQVWL